MSKKREKTVKVAELKAKLSAYLRAARQGHAVVVCDREVPVARLIPYALEAESLGVRKASAPLSQVVLPPPLGGTVDSLAALLAEREPGR